LPLGADFGKRWLPILAYDFGAGVGFTVTGKRLAGAADCLYRGVTV
jgi:hypothetical protein